MGDRRVEVTKQCSHANTHYNFMEKRRSQWHNDFQYFGMGQNQTPYGSPTSAEVADAVRACLSSKASTNSVVGDAMTAFVKRIDPLLQQIGLHPISDDFGLVSADDELVVSQGDLTYTLCYVIGTLKQLMRRSDEILTKITLDDDSLLIQTRTEFPYTLHYANGKEISQKTLLLEKYKLQYPEPLYRKGNVWM